MRRTAVWSVVVALAVAGACASEPDPGAAVRNAPEQTVEAGSAKLVSRVRVHPAEGGESAAAAVSGTGAVDFHTERARLTTTTEDQSVEVLFDGDTLYHLQIVGAEAADWLSVQPDDLSDTLHVDGFASVVLTHALDPLSALHSLRGAGKVERVGKELMRGTSTTWYETTVDLAAAAEEAPSSQRATLRALSDVLTSSWATTNVWLDSDGQVRRLRHTLDFAGVAAPGAPFAPGDVDVTYEFYGYGSPAAIATPPSSDVIAFDTAVDRAARGIGSGTASPETDALVARLLTDVPDGYEQQPDNVGDTGPSDFDKAVRDDGNADARQVLTDDGFVAGYQRLWAKSDEASIIDFVYQFATPEGAAHYQERTRKLFSEDAADAETFEVPGVTGAQGLRVQSDDVTSVVVFLTRGPYLAQVVITGPDAIGDLAVQLAQQQFERLG